MATGPIGVARPRHAGGVRRRGWPADALAVSVITAVAVSSLLPALVHGVALGPYDLLSAFGVTSRPGVVVHNAVSSDQIQQMIPWLTESWRQVHAGHLPLWNPYAGLGMPLAFNWQSAVWSLPTLVAYAFPLKLAYTAAVATKLVVAGSGAYVFGRVCGLGRAAATFAAVTFEVSGPFSVWAGYPIADVMEWTGWVLAFLVLVVRGDRPRRDTALLAVAVAWACLGGNPESVVLLGIATAVFAVVYLVLHFGRDLASTGRAALRIALGGVSGAALAAPLLLPAGQALQRSPRAASSAFGAEPHHDLVYLLFSGFDGRPVAGGGYFGTDNYYGTAAFLGAVALALVVVALVGRRRRPATWGLAAVAAVIGLLCYVQPVNGVIADVGVLRPVIWERALPLLAFALAALAGSGLEEVLRRPAALATKASLAAGFVAMAGILTFLGVRLATTGSRLPPGAAAVRLSSFWWPVAGTAVGLVLSSALLLGRGRRWARPVGGVGSAALFVCSTGFLVSSAAPLWSSDPSGFPQTPQVAAYTRLVGHGLVGFTGTCPRIDSFPSVGLLPEANVGYEVREVAFYDSTLPRSYYLAFLGKMPSAQIEIGVFCPELTTAAEARRFGVSYLVAPVGTPTPPGTLLLRTIGAQEVFSVPGAGPVSLVGPPTAPAPPVPAVDVTGPSTWRITTSAPVRTTMRIRLAGEPGWQATIDGRPLSLHSWDHLMLAATVPPGRHVVELHYLPAAFLAGLALAGATGVAWALAGLAGVRSRGRAARRRAPSAGDVTGAPRNGGGRAPRDRARPAPAGSAPRG